LELNGEAAHTGYCLQQGVQGHGRGDGDQPQDCFIIQLGLGDGSFSLGHYPFIDFSLKMAELTFRKALGGDTKAENPCIRLVTEFDVLFLLEYLSQGLDGVKGRAKPLDYLLEALIAQGGHERKSGEGPGGRRGFQSGIRLTLTLGIEVVAVEGYAFSELGIGTPNCLCGSQETESASSNPANSGFH